MEISNLPDKEFKEMVIMMFTKLESGIQELRTLTKRKYNKEPSRAEEYNN